MVIIWLKVNSSIQQRVISIIRTGKLHPNHLSLVPLVAPDTVVGSFIRVGPHVLTHMSDGFIQLATLTTLVPPLTDMEFHVFLKQVTTQKLPMAQSALKGLVTCIKNMQR